MSNPKRFKMQHLLQKFRKVSHATFSGNLILKSIISTLCLVLGIYGTDNLFANAGRDILKKCERVYIMLTKGESANDVVKSGLSLMKRAGISVYKILQPHASIAAFNASVYVITSIDF